MTERAPLEIPNVIGGRELAAPKFLVGLDEDDVEPGAAATITKFGPAGASALSALAASDRRPARVIYVHRPFGIPGPIVAVLAADERHETCDRHACRWFARCGLDGSELFRVSTTNGCDPNRPWVPHGIELARVGYWSTDGLHADSQVRLIIGRRMHER